MLYADVIGLFGTSKYQKTKTDENSSYWCRKSSYLPNDLKNFNGIFKKNVSYSIKIHKKTRTLAPLWKMQFWRNHRGGRWVKLASPAFFGLRHILPVIPFSLAGLRPYRMLYSKNNDLLLQNKYCVKSIQIRSYFWSLFSHIRTEYRKIRTRNNSIFENFLRREFFSVEVERLICYTWGSSEPCCNE